jgi:hypothetical protein
VQRTKKANEALAKALAFDKKAQRVLNIACAGPSKL